MAEGEVKTRIVIEGEAAYKKALADINRALKESKSELKAVSAEFAGNGESAQALSAQIGVLERTHAQQSEQLQLMQAHLHKVTKAYGENSKEAVELRTKINNARAEMAKTANDLTQLRTRLDATGDAMGDLAGETGGAESGIRQIGEQADRAQKQVGDLGDELGGLDDMIPDLKGKLAGAMTIGAVGKGLGEVFGLANDELVAWQNLAAYTGETGDNLERLKGVSRDVYNEGYGDSLMEVTTTVSQIYQQTGLMDDDLAHCVETALSLSRVFGMDVGESTRAVTALMQNFGIDAETAYDLIVTGAQNGADRNGNLLDTINEYSPYFAGAGKGADEFFAALIGGAQAGVYDVDKIGDAWKEFMLRVTSGDEGAKDALKELGFEATDVTRKIAAGGPAADLATSQIIEALLRVEDPYRQNELGIALFGTQWEDTAGRCLTVFGDMEDGLGDVTGASETLNKVTMSDFDAALEGTKRRIGYMFAEFMTPAAGAATAFLQRVNQEIDEADGKILTGFGNAITGIISDTFTVQQGVEAARAAGAAIGEAWGEGYAEAVAAALKDPETEVTATPPEIDGLFDAYSAAAGSGDTELAAQLQAQIDAAASKAMQDAAQGKTPISIDDLFAARAQAAGEGNSELAAELDAQIEAVISGMTETGAKGAAEGAQEIADSASQGALDALSGATPAAQRMGEYFGVELVSGTEDGVQGMVAAGEDAAQGVIDALSGATPAAQRMGETFGGELVLGTEDGTEGMYGAGEDAAQGAIDGARSGISAMYNAGAALGGAFRRGFRDKMLIKSPSRAAMEDMAYVTEGYLTQAERDRERVAGAANELAQALREGFTAPQPGAGYGYETATGAGAAGVTPESLREALSGMAFVLDAESMSVRLEPYVSRATQDRIAGTASGQSSRAKNW